MTNIGSGRLARTYGQALFLACAEEQFDGVSGELQQFCRLLIAAPNVAEALNSPIIPSEQKSHLISAIAERVNLSQAVTNLLRLVAERGRFAIIHQISDAFGAAVREFRQILALEVTVARAVSEDEQAQIRERLQLIVHPAVSVAFRVAPDVVGGLVVRSGDKVFDASVRTRLRRLGRSLVSSNVAA